MFHVEGLNYKLQIDRAGVVSLGLIGGETCKGRAIEAFNLFDDLPVYEDVDLVRNAMTVIQSASKILLTYIHEVRPHLLQFTASTGRKIQLFAWITGRMLRRVAGYDVYEYPKGTFVIFKVSHLP